MEFEDKLLVDYNHARKAMSKFFCQHSDVVGTALLDEFKKKAGLWLSLDSSAYVEIAILEALMGPSGAKKVQDFTMACLPSAERQWCEQDALNRLKEAKRGGLFKMSPSSTQASLTLVEETVSQMMKGKRPKSENMSTDPFMQKVLERLAFFCYETDPQDASKMLLGAVAAKHRVQELKKKSDGGAQVTLEDMRCVHAYSWLLDDADAKILKSMSEKVVKAFRRPDGPAVASASSSSKQSRKQNEKKNKSEVDDLASLFR